MTFQALMQDREEVSVQVAPTAQPAEVGGGWQLISRLGDATDLLSDADMRWFRQIGGVVADVSGEGSVNDLDVAYERCFARYGCEALLAPPDFYVFAAGEHTDIPRFVSRLRQALQPISAAGK